VEEACCILIWKQFPGSRQAKLQENTKILS
jgi:hypothetical protein